jgi:hypothetical protein
MANTPYVKSPSSTQSRTHPVKRPQNKDNQTYLSSQSLTRLLYFPDAHFPITHSSSRRNSTASHPKGLVLQRSHNSLCLAYMNWSSVFVCRASPVWTCDYISGKVMFSASTLGWAKSTRSTRVRVSNAFFKRNLFGTISPSQSAPTKEARRGWLDFLRQHRQLPSVEITPSIMVKPYARAKHVK